MELMMQVVRGGGVEEGEKGEERCPTSLTCVWLSPGLLSISLSVFLFSLLLFLSFSPSSLA